jgi:hypothetical protein
MTLGEPIRIHRLGKGLTGKRALRSCTGVDRAHEYHGVVPNPEQAPDGVDSAARRAAAGGT